MAKKSDNPKAAENRSALLISYHFPPIAVSSGVHRMVSLANALIRDNWRLTVLSAHTRTYARVDESSLQRIDPQIRIRRAQAFDTAKHLSIKGKYLQMMALPDNYQSWIAFGVLKGLGEIIRRRPDVLISTYPVASAHVIAVILHRITGIPWVADFRDPMAQDGYPNDPAKWKAFKWIEERAARYATRLVFTTPGALAEYRERYPQVEDHRWLLVTNGFDEEPFSQVVPQLRNDGLYRIVHSGLIYLHERNPRHFFQALAELKQAGYFKERRVLFVLRASGHETTYQQWIDELDISELIRLAPALPYREALKELLESDGLLLLQGEGCNQQIPAKAYEYIRAEKPVLALTDENGDTAKLLKSVGNATIAPLNDTAPIVTALKDFIGRLEGAGNTVRGRYKDKDTDRFSRQKLSRAWVSEINRALSGSEPALE